MSRIRKAEKKRLKLRMGLAAPTGGGKTYTALVFATELAKRTGQRVGVIDTEHRSSELYADIFDFDVINLDESHRPREYVTALREFADAGNYGCVIIDSLSHAWMGKDGALEQVDAAAKKNRGGNSYVAWRDVTPQHNELVEALLAAPFHLIATLRSKMDYVQEEGANGKKSIRKVGMAPVQRDGMEYEFTVFCDLDVDHNLIVTKTRFSAIDGLVVTRPDGKLARKLADWLDTGEREETLPAMPKPSDEPTLDEAERPLIEQSNGDVDPSQIAASHQQLDTIARLADERVVDATQYNWIAKRVQKPMSAASANHIIAQLEALPVKQGVNNAPDAGEKEGADVAIAE